jgi:hypothetical protein
VVVDARGALQPGALAVWEEALETSVFAFSGGTRKRPERRLRRQPMSSRSSSSTIGSSRRLIEPRAAIGSYDATSTCRPLPSASGAPSALQEMKLFHKPAVTDDERLAGQRVGLEAGAK